MRFIETDIPDCRIVELEPFEDERGYFARAWCADEMTAEGLTATAAQVNMSLSVKPGTIRGLHWRPLDHPEAKFIRCIGGRVFDVCVDLRPDSPAFLTWVGVELTPDNRRALAVPAGCAHGYQALEPNSEVLYMASSPYVPGVEIGARWDDPAFGIEWPITGDVTLSDKDRSWPDFATEVSL